ncbi:glycosyltransferase [Paludibaculum fermentans]|uniref:Glycosyltransferase n=1 Tax=Paludibaculum fermentans TaxID=1473598 RepID=A0A7S7NRR1_PALFE|nr:glycosyltransferase [Paludibaculum fermentans]QOY88636.1 glycosyltransferase [Paludibaculum fermentans]
MLLSILIPVYNERTVVERSLQQVLDAPLPAGVDRELVIVDDCSKDGTWAILEGLAAKHSLIRLYRHEVNQGKGAAVRTAISKAQGDFCLIQDADLEYDPNEYPALLKPLLAGHADAVFGSRYMSGEARRVLPYWHTKINEFLTWTSNVFSNIHVTDMETCYKVFRTDLLKSIPIRSNRFGFEPEITMKCAKRQLRIYEVPISYHGRTYEEGKKIGWKDGLQALGVILKYWLIDDIYADTKGRGALINLTRTPGYIDWMSGLLRPYLGDTILEIGAGFGTFSGRLMGRRLRYVAAESDPLHLHALRNRFLRTPNVTVVELDPNRRAAFDGFEGSVDSAIAINVLEGLPHPEIALEGLHRALKPGGRLLLLAPQGSSIYGTVDQAMGQFRRFDQREIETLLRAAGFNLEAVRQINKSGKPAWWLASKVFRRTSLSKLPLKIFDKNLWLWRPLDHVLPWKGLSMLVVARKQ